MLVLKLYDVVLTRGPYCATVFLARLFVFILFFVTGIGRLQWDVDPTVSPIGRSGAGRGPRLATRLDVGRAKNAPITNTGEGNLSLFVRAYSLFVQEGLTIVVLVL